MDPDASTSTDKPPIINYVLSFLLVGVAWGFTMPFIRRAAADFNKRQESRHGQQPVPEEVEGEEQELQAQSSRQRRGDGDGDNKVDNDTPAEIHAEVEQEEEEEVDQPLQTPSEANQTPKPAWMSQTSRTSWLRTKLTTLFWTVINLLRTPAYSIPLVINLTGSIWFFLLVGKHELSLTVPLANSSAFLFTVLGEWYVERKVIAKETWLGLALVLGGIGLCVHSKQ